MHDAGDAYVFYITPVSKKTKYHICTLDLKNTKYIADKLTDKDNTELSDNLVRIFSWDLDTFKVIDSSLVTKVVPLSTVLAQSNLIAEQPKYKRN
jgi:hypothetical protein